MYDEESAPVRKKMKPYARGPLKWIPKISLHGDQELECREVTTLPWVRNLVPPDFQEQNLDTCPWICVENFSGEKKNLDTWK